MIIFAAMLASGQVLPWLDRPWLNEQVRIEAAAAGSPKRALKLAPPVSAKAPRKLMSYENTVGM
jgi:hypothetical protein